MIQKRKVKRKIKKKEFFKYISEDKRKRLEKLSKDLGNHKVTHFNATPKGGGVAELLSSLIPYLRSLGVESEWYAIDSTEVDISFFEITDKLRDALQSKHEPLTDEEWREYKEVNEKLGEELKKINTDLFVVHDWQVLYSGTLIPDNQRKIYINHPDTSNPCQGVWEKILEMILEYDLRVFSNPSFVHGDLKDKEKTRIIKKSIDPLNQKQKVVPPKQAREHLKAYGIPEDGPLIVQVSRFDPWKNPKDVIRAFKGIQEDYPNAHLAMVGLQEAKDNPEAARYFEEVNELVDDLDRISMFFDTEKHGIKDISEFTMYVQNAADIIIQNSTKEGFGLTVSEALWKRKPVIGGNASGVRLQIKDGWNGYITDNKEELKKKMKKLLENPSKRKELGKNGREYVRENFLFPRFVEDHLSTYNEILN